MSENELSTISQDNAAQEASRAVQEALAAIIGRELPGFFLVYTSRNADMAVLPESEYPALISASAHALGDEVRDGSFDRLDARSQASENGFPLIEVFADWAGAEQAQAAKDAYIGIIADAVGEYGDAAARAYLTEGRFGFFHRMCSKAKKTCRKTKFSQATYDKTLHDAADKIFSKALSVADEHSSAFKRGLF